MLANEFDSLENLIALKRSSRKIIKLAQEYNDLTQKNPSVLLPNLISIALNYNVSDINLTDIKKNSPGKFIMDNSS